MRRKENSTLTAKSCLKRIALGFSMIVLPLLTEAAPVSESELSIVDVYDTQWFGLRSHLIFEKGRKLVIIDQYNQRVVGMKVSLISGDEKVMRSSISDENGFVDFNSFNKWEDVEIVHVHGMWDRFDGQKIDAKSMLVLNGISNISVKLLESSGLPIMSPYERIIPVLPVTRESKRQARKNLRRNRRNKKKEQRRVNKVAP
ncbi:MAG: hypothetical protein ACI837_000479 [Crocinitomicaceae bacterium]|jgi:hypothetical protein